MSIVDLAQSALKRAAWAEKKAENKRTKKSASRSYYFLERGNAWNPLLKWPRNTVCFCGETELKAKKCCLPKLKWYVSKKDAAEIKARMASDRRLK